MTAVWALALPDSEKIVLLALADCANDEGHCWPGIKSLVAKCSKSERTIQGAIQRLVDAGHLSRREVMGKGCNYTVHPRNGCAPAETAPTPAGIAGRPRSGCGQTVKNRKEPSPHKRAIPANWQPEEFSIGSQSRHVVDGWPPGECAAQLEQFLAHHAAKGNTFTDAQQAWSTWVLNTRKFGVGRNEQRLGKTTAAIAGLGGFDDHSPM
jgi:hypothetical protein